MKKELPKVSVVTITYGHGKYITETLNGVLMQDYPGEIEFIIANDHSPDDTDEVIRQYFATNPVPGNFEIKYTKHDTNKGMMPNFIWALQQATGRYVALCEGDDYWTDPFKLQKQVEFLEQNEEYVLCFANRNVLENNELIVNEPLYDKYSFTKTEIPRVHIPTLTAVFRNFVGQIPAKMHNTFIDCSLFLFLSQYGSFYYLDESVAVYRVHQQGMYSGSSAFSNFRRSTKARVVAWSYLNDIDKMTLAYVITDWNRLKKQAALRDRKYISAAVTFFLDRFMEFYVLKENILKKFKKTIAKK